MDMRRSGGSDYMSQRNSPHPEFEPNAPSPESIAASPMLISSRNSECGDPPIESDEGCSISDSGETSRRSTISRMDMTDLSRDIEIKKKYPELYQMIVSHGHRRMPSSESRDSLPAVPRDPRDESRDALYREALELLKKCRKMERDNRDLKKNYDSVLATNKQIKETYVKIYAKAEQEEEYISNILLKRIQKLKNDKETLAQKYEQEEEYLTNDLMRKIQQLQSERDMLEGKVKNEQASLIDNLLTTIRRMESEMQSGRKNMDKMRKEKIDQENALEHEQELLFNTLGKQMDQLNVEKRKMQASLQKAYMHGYVESGDEDMSVGPAHSTSEPIVIDAPPRTNHSSGNEVHRLRSQLRRAEAQIHDLREKDTAKNAQIRHLEDLINGMMKEKEGLCRGIEETLQRYNSKTDLSSVGMPAIRPDLTMGPPSVPATPRNVDYVSDMDDSSSRGSLSQSDFSMN